MRDALQLPGSKTMKKIHVATFLLAILATSTASAEDIDAVVRSCADCHGDNGVSQWADIPTIAGIDSFVGSEALYIYRDNARPCATSKFRQGDTDRPPTDMCAVVSEFSDEIIKAIADHFAQLPFIAAKQEFDESLVATGKAIHDRDCERCHSDGGSNADDEAGILAGQWSEYLRTTFNEYASGEREQLDKMKSVMDGLDDSDTEALLAFYASQQ